MANAVVDRSGLAVLLRTISLRLVVAVVEWRLLEADAVPVLADSSWPLSGSSTMQYCLGPRQREAQRTQTPHDMIQSASGRRSKVRTARYRAVRT